MKTCLQKHEVTFSGDSESRCRQHRSCLSFSFLWRNIFRASFWFCEALAPNITGLAGFKLKRVALSELSNWFTYPHRCPVLSTKFLGANGDLMVSIIECSTYASNTILPPMGKFFYYTIPGYDAKSSKIVRRGLLIPLVVSSGQELWLLYDKGSRDRSEHDSNGTSCTNVFAKKFVDAMTIFIDFKPYLMIILTA